MTLELLVPPDPRVNLVTQVVPDLLVCKVSAVYLVEQDLLANQEALVSVVFLVLMVKTVNLDFKVSKVYQDLWDLLENAVFRLERNLGIFKRWQWSFSFNEMLNYFRVKMVKTESQDLLDNLDLAVILVKTVLVVLKVLLDLLVLMVGEVLPVLQVHVVSK